MSVVVAGSFLAVAETVAETAAEVETVVVVETAAEVETVVVVETAVVETVVEFAASELVELIVCVCYSSGTQHEI